MERVELTRHARYSISRLYSSTRTPGFKAKYGKQIPHTRTHALTHLTLTIMQKTGYRSRSLLCSRLRCQESAYASMHSHTPLQLPSSQHLRNTHSTTHGQCSPAALPTASSPGAGAIGNSACACKSSRTAACAAADPARCDAAPAAPGAPAQIGTLTSV